MIDLVPACTDLVWLAWGVGLGVHKFLCFVHRVSCLYVLRYIRLVVVVYPGFHVLVRFCTCFPGYGIPVLGNLFHILFRWIRRKDSSPGQ